MIPQNTLSPPARPASENPPRLRRIQRGRWRQYQSLYGWEWTHARLPVQNLPASLGGLRLIHLTDLHMRDHWPVGLDAILERIAANPPDLVLFTGDFVDDKSDYRPALPYVCRFLENLTSRLGTYAIVGNHDGLALSAALADQPVTLLNGQRLRLDHRDAQIELIGLPGPFRYDLSDAFIQSMPPPAAGIPRIVLSHFPGHFPAAAPLRPDLFLAGHTHGGQICLPPGIPILRHDPMPRRLCHGIHRLSDAWYIVGRGVGFSGFPLRLFCPNQVIEIELIP
jgi:predicted MPP superfamily phosphohydrolase